MVHCDTFVIGIVDIVDIVVEYTVYILWHVIYIVARKKHKVAFCAPFRQMQNWFRNRVFVILGGLTHSALAIFSWEKSPRALQNVLYSQ